MLSTGQNTYVKVCHFDAAWQGMTATLLIVCRGQAAGEPQNWLLLLHPAPSKPVSGLRPESHQSTSTVTAFGDLQASEDQELCSKPA